MSGSFVRRVLRGGFLASTIVAAVALGGGTTLAAHQVGHSGTTGSYSWTDSSAHPAGLCDYTGGGAAGHTYIVGVRVNAPATAKWPTGQASTWGYVGFRVELQHLSGGSWTTVNWGPQTTANATTTASAMLSNRRVAWAGPLTGKDRGLAVLTWYRPNWSILGSARVVIDHYANNFDSVARAYCPVSYCDVCAPAAAAGVAAIDTRRSQV